MFWPALVALLSLPPASLAAAPGSVSVSRGALPIHHRATSVSGATLIAYGTNISGYPIHYTSDGSLRLAPDNSTTSGLSSITWDVPSLSSAPTSPSKGTMVNGTSAGSLYIVTSGSGAMGVSTDPNGITNASVNGFAMYGSQLVYYNGSSIQSRFWATPDNEAGTSTWGLFWNSDNTPQDAATPIVIKSRSDSSAS